VLGDLVDNRLEVADNKQWAALFVEEVHYWDQKLNEEQSRRR
jgi:hypothetical protein